MDMYCQNNKHQNFKKLQALAIVRVKRLAAASRCASCRAAIILATALTVLGLCGSRSRGRRGPCAGRGASTTASSGASSVSTSDGTDFDVREDDLYVAGVGFKLSRLAGCRCTSSTSTTRVGIGNWVSRVEPQHLGGVVVPDTQNQDHTFSECLTHSSQTALLREGVAVAKGSLLSVTEVVGDGVVGIQASNVGLGVWNNLPILNIETADFSQGSRCGVVGSQELSHNGELLVGVDSESWAIEARIAHTEAVEIATSLVTDTLG